MVLATGGTSDQTCSRARYCSLTNDGVNSTEKKVARSVDVLQGYLTYSPCGEIHSEV